ncbi:hypothetical protein NC651_012700 [Populus alba x Populus x berolinensis]|uniref:Uncharacterized protein n=1 Tax=Populus alba x Populus x berolinensis TaxID=444605 RepID=A0AAD6W305_9ROSI|nr:hypothetical protein NC651_012700 [Populus alba x Populus x berolinensis]KAJ6996289.1 hypothetical protein NC653_013017 [Populus alba x Populus x berolinensis]
MRTKDGRFRRLRLRLCWGSRRNLTS